MDKDRKKQLSLALKYVSKYNGTIMYNSTREKAMKKYNLTIEEFSALRLASIARLDEEVILSRITQIKTGMNNSDITVIMEISV